MNCTEPNRNGTKRILMILCNVGKRSHCRCMRVLYTFVCLCVWYSRTNRKKRFISFLYCCEKKKRNFFVGNKKWLSQTSLWTSYFFAVVDVSHFKLITIFMRIAKLFSGYEILFWNDFLFWINFLRVLFSCVSCTLLSIARISKLVDHTYTHFFDVEFFFYASFLNFGLYCYSIFLFCSFSLCYDYDVRLLTCLLAW